MKTIIIVLLFPFLSCTDSNLFIDLSKVLEIEISSSEDPTLVFIEKDKSKIRSLISSCVNGSRQEPLVFKMNYRIVIKEANENNALFINNTVIKFKGYTYRSSCNTEVLIRKTYPIGTRK